MPPVPSLSEEVSRGMPCFWLFIRFGCELGHNRPAQCRRRHSWVEGEVFQAPRTGRGPPSSSSSEGALPTPNPASLP